MAMISLRPAEGQREAMDPEVKTEHDEPTNKHPETECSGQQKFNAFRPWLSQEEKEEDLNDHSVDYGKRK